MRRPDRHDVAWAIVSFTAAAVARVTLAGTHPYGDEAHHYYIAREFGAPPSNLVGGVDLHWLFWWRPLFSLLLSPWAQGGFEWMRVGYILMTALLASVGYLLVRGHGASRGAAVGAAALLGLHPFLVVWGVRAFPDELMAVAYLLALLLWAWGRRVAAAGTFLAAAWIKEVALVGLALLLAEHLWRTRDGWRPRVDRATVALAAALALSYVPHWVAEAMGGRPPGWTRGGAVWPVIDGVFLTPWFIPLVAGATLSPVARRLALHALAYAGFFAAYALILGGAAEQWYFVLPTILAFAAVAAALGDLVRRWMLQGGQAKASAALAPLALVVVILLVQVLAPTASSAKQAVHLPDWDGLDFSAKETWEYERKRDEGLWQAIEAMTAEDRQAVLLVDVAWFFSVWPFPEISGAVGAGFTGDNQDSSEAWSHVIETMATSTVMARTSTPLNEALRATYHDCIAYENHDYVVVRGMQCPGRAAMLDAERNARLTAPLPS